MCLQGTCLIKICFLADSIASLFKYQILSEKVVIIEGSFKKTPEFHVPLKLCKKLKVSKSLTILQLRKQSANRIFQIKDLFLDDSIVYFKHSKGKM